MRELTRPFGFWTTICMVVGSMVGSGIFVLPATLAPSGWTGTASWFVGGVGVIAIAMVLVGLTSAKPEEPSILTICGHSLGLLPGRLIAWSYWVSTWCSAAVVALVGAGYLLRALPVPMSSNWASALLGSAIIALLTVVQLVGVQWAGRVQVLTTAIKLVPLVVVMAIIGFVALTSPASFSGPGIPSFELGKLTPALAIAFFALIGFDSAGIIAERVSNPRRNVVRATLVGLMLVLGIYIVISTGIMMLTPIADLSASSSPLADFATRFLGPGAGVIMALFAGISAVGCLNGTILASAELPLGMVRDGQLPGWMARTNVREVPAAALVLASTLAIVLILLGVTVFGARVFDFMLRLTTASALWFYAGICLAGLATGIRRGFAIVGLGFCAWLLYGTGFEAGSLGMLLMVVAVPLHFLIGAAREIAPKQADIGSKAMAS